MNGAALARNAAAAHLLDVWEEGAAKRPAERGLLLLQLATPQLDDQAPADLTVGERDRRLLRLHERWFGPAITAVEPCPWCGVQLELTFHVADVLVTAGSPAADVHVTAVDGYEIAFRLPTARLLAAVAAQTDLAGARAALLAGCLAEIRHDGEPVPADGLPVSVIDHIGRAMETIDPQANVELALRCTACEREWPVVFDIVAYLWDEISVWSRQIIHEVHRLASAYGWSEREVLAMGAARRAVYLEMADGG